jgi:hypothetical protein
MSPSAMINTSSLAFSTILTNAEGAKQLPSLYKDGEPVIWQPNEYVEIPFEPSAFNDETANRVTLCVSPSAAMIEAVNALDAWCIDTLVKNVTSLLGIQLTPDQIRDRYMSSLKTSEKGYTTFRMKMKSGRYALQCYTPDKEKRDHPEDWRGTKISCRVIFKGLWVMGKDFGCLMECTHALVQEGGCNDECPF